VRKKGARQISNFDFGREIAKICARVAPARTAAEITDPRRQSFFAGDGVSLPMPQASILWPTTLSALPLLTALLVRF